MGYLILVSIIWAFSFGLIGSHLADLDSTFVATARILLSFLVFLPFLRLKKVPLTGVLRVAAVGALQFGVMYVAFIRSFAFLPAHQVALLTVTTPLLVAGLSGMGRGRRLETVVVASSIMAVVGAAVVLWQAPKLSDALLGVALVQISNGCFAFGQLEYRRLKRAYRDLSDRELHALLYLGAVVVTGVAALLSGAVPESIPRQGQLLVLLYLGVVASGLCFFWWNIGASRVNAGTLAAFNNLKIPLAVAVSLILFETASAEAVLRAAVGCCLVLGAIVLAERYRPASRAAR